MAGVPEQEIEEILSVWKGGTLWDLVSIIPDRRYSLAILERHKLIEEPEEK